MTTRFKGFYQKSFKCFSDILDVKEDEMEIGYPTDVRHVSHIGWDNSSRSSSAPSWLHEFKTSKDVLEPNSSWPFEDLKSAMEDAFGEVENNKGIGRESKKQNLKKKLSSKASQLCNPWSPRFSRSSKIFV